MIVKASNKDSGTRFLNPGARLAFTKLRQAFSKAPILHYFDLKCHIWIETNISGYVICRLLNQLAMKNLHWWYSIVFSSRKIISAKTWYKTYNGELLAIIKTFKTWYHYWEDCKYGLLIFINHNNLGCFMDTKSLSSRQVY